MGLSENMTTLLTLAIWVVAIVGIAAQPYNNDDPYEYCKYQFAASDQSAPVCSLTRYVARGATG